MRTQQPRDNPGDTLLPSAQAALPPTTVFSGEHTPGNFYESSDVNNYIAKPH